MEINSDMVHVFCNTELTVNHLKGILMDSGIDSFIRNDYEAGNAAGFVGGTASTIDLYIKKDDAERAAGIIEEFKKSLEEQI